MALTRDLLQERENKTLAPYASFSAKSKGRKFEEAFDDERLCYQRDKDRIIHCKAFRRLDAKTQVFIAGSGDHYRTRLTHTLEVAQIARDIARRLQLNEDLCEAIALAHDLGHPPFGHGGEEKLDDVMHRFGMHFEHNEQSRRVVEVLEKTYPFFDGLNLTHEVLDGLIKHQTAWDQAGKEFEVSSHLEAQVVNIADEIAYMNHDMDDGLRSGILSIEGLEKFEIWEESKERVNKKYGDEMESGVFISRIVSQIISMMISDFCATSETNIVAGIDLSFSSEMKRKIATLRKHLFSNFYMSEEVTEFIEKGQMMIERLFDYYMENPQDFPVKNRNMREEFIVDIKDYIAGMTDNFLIQEFNAKLSS